jgi:glycerophosphoryl diester phosphodiesterase
VTRRVRGWIAVLAVAAVATIPGAALAAGPGDGEAEPRLLARAVLPADTFADGPPSGAALGTAPINGRTPPFPGQPVQGFSALIGGGQPGVYLALADNGFGAKANSADFLLRAYRIRPRWGRAGGGPGTVEVLGFIQFRDPDRMVDWPIVNQDTDDRLLTGADFDVESIRRAPDGTLWVGDEFGPFLLHFSAAGVLLEAPVPFPVPKRLAAYGKDQDEVRSPDNPAFFDLPDDAARVAAANLPRSRGIEGMALSSDGRTLYPSLEGALVADPNQNRRVVYAYDLAKRRFRNWTADYFTDAPGNAIGDLTAASRDVLLLIERDNLQGAEAATKRIYELEIDRLRGRAIPKTFLVDLLRIANPDLIGGPSQPGTIGLGDPFGFPFQTIESVLVLDRRTLVVANDNNYPFSSGRRPGQPDDNELIQVRLPRRLPSG